jgi:hypothetical protein
MYKYKTHSLQMRASVLSDDKVISTVNEFFIPLSINVTTDGFPSDVIPALKHAENIYKTNWRFSFGFASCSAVDNEGKIPLGYSSAAQVSGNRNQDPDMEEYMSVRNFMLFMVEALERHKQILGIKAKFRYH